MIHYIVRRLLFAVPTLAAISFILFALLDLAPNDPTGQLPLTIPAEAREQIRESLGLGEPFHIRYAKWMEQFFVNEPLNLIEQAFGVEIGDSESRLRVRSWATRSPVVDLIVERLPQTLWVVGLSYLIGILIAVPIGIVSAYRQYSWFDQLDIIGITSWMQTARIVRGDVLALREREFVTAARSIRTRRRRIITRHILPNVLSPIMVSATLGIANAIIIESALSFLGLGFPPDFPTWGRLLFDGANFISVTPARVLWPGLAISLTVLSVNYIGDGLRDALDPRLRGA